VGLQQRSSRGANEGEADAEGEALEKKNPRVGVSVLEVKVGLNCRAQA